jgi:hypothetical protein
MNFLAVVHARLTIGFLQGLALYALYRAAESALWPATNALVFAPLLLVAAIVPTLMGVGLSQLRPRTLLSWGLALSAVLIGLAIYNITRRGNLNASASMWLSAHSGIFPSYSLIAFTILGACIAQCLVTASDVDNRAIASYPRYFDVAWKLTIQLKFSAVFVILFWIILEIGASLFNLIGIDLIRDLINHSWFFIPVTTMVTAYAIHLTDVRLNLVRSIRILVLVLLSWLLPVMVLFVAAFMISLPVKGYTMLWGTHHASQLFLGTSLLLILLINAAYQDGLPDHGPSKILRYSGSLGALLLLPLVVFAAYAIFLRANQYGWTVNLVDSGIFVIVMACYAIGYMGAVVTPGAWLHGIEKTNIYTSFVILAVLLALFSPLADPARIAVTNQMDRLKSGKVSAEKFDYSFLYNQGQIYGLNALNKLKQETNGPDAAIIKERATQALTPQAPSTPPPSPIMQADDIANNISVYPVGHTLPKSFSNKNWSALTEDRSVLPNCLFVKSSKCDAYIADATNATPQYIILMNSAFRSAGIIFSFDNGQWVLLGMTSNRIACHGISDAIKAGEFKIVPSNTPELDVNGVRIQITQTHRNDTCP